MLALILAAAGCQNSSPVVLKAEFETWVPDPDGYPLRTQENPDRMSNCLMLLECGKLSITVSDGSGYTPDGTINCTISDPTAVSLTSAGNGQYDLQILRPEARRVSLAVTFVATGSSEPVTRVFSLVFAKRLFSYPYYHAVDLDTGNTVTWEQWDALSDIEKAAYDFTEQWASNDTSWVTLDFRAGFIQIPDHIAEFVSYIYYPKSENLPIGEYHGDFEDTIPEWKPPFFIVKTSEGRFFKMMISGGTILDYIELLPID